MDTLLILGGAAVTLTGGSEFAGRLNQTPLIGLSIYFDYDMILNALDSEDRAKFKTPVTDIYSVASTLVRVLSKKEGDHVEPFPYLKPIMASSYFDDTELPANMCRHKAIIMKAILNRIGIDANLVTGTVESDNGRGEHVWLYIPKINQVADPMNNMVMSPEEYQKRFKPAIHFNVVQWAKPLGIMGR